MQEEFNNHTAGYLNPAATITVETAFGSSLSARNSYEKAIRKTFAHADLYLSAKEALPDAELLIRINAKNAEFIFSSEGTVYRHCSFEFSELPAHQVEKYRLQRNSRVSGFRSLLRSQFDIEAVHSYLGSKILKRLKENNFVFAQEEIAKVACKHIISAWYEGEVETRPANGFDFNR